MSISNNGSSTELNTLAPKIILAPLINAMISTLKDRKDGQYVFYYGPTEPLHFDISVFVSAVFKKIGEKNDSNQIYNIIKDIQLMPVDSKLRISTLFDKESEVNTANSYRELDDKVAELMKGVVAQSPNQFKLMSLNKYLGGCKEIIKSPQSTKKFNAFPFEVKGPSKILSLEYTNDLKAKDGLLRLFTVIEELNKPDWVKEVCDAIKGIVKQSYGPNEKIPTESIEYIDDILHQQCSQENNEILELLNFVETKALARARTKNSFKIMEILADRIEKSKGPNDLAVMYIRKVIAFFECFGAPILPWNVETTTEIKNRSINVGAIYGAIGELDFNRQLGFVGASDALPIWVKPQIEMNDVRKQNKEGLSLKREVTYSFKVNGEFSNEAKAKSFNSKLALNYYVIKTFNGNKTSILRNPNDSLITAYEAKLHSINEGLLLGSVVNDKGEFYDEEYLKDECRDRVASNELFQLIMLYFVLSGDEQPIESFQSSFDKLAESLKNPLKIRSNLSKILQLKLNSKEMHDKVKTITETLNAALKSNFESIINEMQKDASLKTLMYIHPDIVNLNAFRSLGLEDDVEQNISIFNDKNSNYYDHIIYVDGSRKSLARLDEAEKTRMNGYVKKALSQIEFSSTLKIKTLIPIPNTEFNEFTAYRDLNMLCLPVVMTPIKPRKSENEPLHSFNLNSLSYDDFLSMNQVMVHYNANLFRLKPLSNRQSHLCLDEVENGLIISSMCFSIILHLFMKHLIKEVKSLHGMKERLYVPFLRIDSVDEQENETNAKVYRTTKGKANQKGGFNPEVKKAYATAYTLEKLLNNDDACFKVQGLKYQPNPNPYFTNDGHRLCTPFNLAMAEGINFRANAAIEALSGYTSVIVPFEGTKDRIACISYNSRPENDVEFKYRHQADSLTLKTDYSYICYVYILERINEKQGRLFLQEVSHAPVSEDNLRSSKAMHRIIEKLQLQGTQDVVLHSHHFAQRKIGKTEINNLIHESESALDQLDELFPDMNFYPFQSDTIAALSLVDKVKGEVYEIPHNKYHTASVNKSDVKQSLSVYSLATKRTVGVRTQHGICSYFYMLTSQQHSMYNAKRTQLHSLIVDPVDTPEMKSIRSVLRGIHYFESERPKMDSSYNPILEPSHIRGTTGIQELGEIIVSNRINKGEVLVSLPAMIGKLENYIITAKEKVEQATMVDTTSEETSSDTKGE